MQPFTVSVVVTGTTGVAATPVTAGALLAAYTGGYIMGMTVSDDNANSVNVNDIQVGIGTAGGVTRILGQYTRQSHDPMAVPFDFRGGDDKGGIRIGPTEQYIWINSTLINTVRVSIQMTIWGP